MRNLEQARAEVFRRSEEKIRENKRMRRRALTLCVPLALCLVIGAAAWPAFAPAAKQAGNEPAAVVETPPGQAWDQEAEAQYSDGALEAPQADTVRIGSEEAAVMLRALGRANGLDNAGGEVVSNGNAGPDDDRKGTPVQSVDASASEYSGEDLYGGSLCLVLVTPDGEETYTLQGNVLTCETGNWQRTLTEDEMTALLQTLGLPADESR